MHDLSCVTDLLFRPYDPYACEHKTMIPSGRTYHILPCRSRPVVWLHCASKCEGVPAGS